MLHISVKHAHDSGVPVWVRVALRLILLCGHHDVGMRTCVQRILRSAKVVSGMIDPQDLVTVNPVVDEYQRAPFFVCILMLITVILLVRQP